MVEAEFISEYSQKIWRIVLYNYYIDGFLKQTHPLFSSIESVCKMCYFPLISTVFLSFCRHFIRKWRSVLLSVNINFLRRVVCLYMCMASTSYSNSKHCRALEKPSGLGAICLSVQVNSKTLVRLISIQMHPHFTYASRCAHHHVVKTKCAHDNQRAVLMALLT